MHCIRLTALILFCLFLIMASSAYSLGKDSESPQPSNKSQTTVDLYILDVAYDVQRYWEFDPGPETSPHDGVTIEFTVMPDGVIKDIRVIEESGDNALKEAALTAIQRASPTKPFPKDINEELIRIGQSFSTYGVK